ncbi:MAG TPA: hypothetical protein VJ010_11135 [Actinomycetota bacterium]|nr:hypothetical protein [Actinomycetota bacterium]
MGHEQRGITSQGVHEGSRIRLEVEVILFGVEELVGFVSALQTA